jgi:flagellar biosynthesis/type III secretory pathway protein FliH
LLAAALQDLEALPTDAWERSVTTPLLIHFGRARRGKLETNEEDDVSAEMQAWLEDYKRQLHDEGLRAGRDEGLRAGRDEGLRTGRDEGRAEEAARAVLTVLRVRNVAVPDAARERILAQKEPALLEHWLEKAAVATSVADVLGDPS